jgi:hypothetical protein
MAVLAVSIFCFFMAIYLGGLVAFQIDIAPRVQITQWATVFFIVGLVTLFVLLFSYMIGRTVPKEA